MVPVVKATDIASLARDVAKTDESIGLRLTPRPWNPRQAKSTHWYLSPTPEWPVFRYGKALLRSDQGYADRQGTNLFSCFFVEKGPSAAKTAELYPSHRRNYLSDATWLWSSVLDAMATGDLDPIVEEVARASGQPVVLEIAVSTLSPGAVAEGKGNPWELEGYVRFQLEGPALVPLNSNPGAHLQSVASLSRIEQIPDALGRNEKLDWFWIDLYIGVELWLGSVPDRNNEIWNGAHVWDRTLRPWLPWIR